MVNVNFLPWRRMRQVYQAKVVKQFISISLLLILFVICIPYFWFKYKEDQLIETISSLKQNLAMLEEEQTILGNSVVLAQEGEGHITAIAGVSALFSALSQNSDPMVCFSSVAKHKNTVAFNGESRSITDLSIFIASWPAAKFFSEIKIEKLAEKENHKVQFRLRAIEKV